MAAASAAGFGVLAALAAAAAGALLFVFLVRSANEIEYENKWTEVRTDFESATASRFA